MTTALRPRPVLLLPLLVSALLPVLAQPAERFTLGVLRRDGVIVPFAAFDGQWSTPWPAAMREVELPITLADVPKKWWGGDLPAAWTLWPPGGAPGVRLAPKSPIAILVGRERRLGVLTDYVSPEPAAPPTQLPYPKEGLAVAGNVKVETISPVSRLSAAYRDLTKTLKDEIDEAEDKAVSGIRSGARWSHPVARERRRTVLADLEAWYTSSLQQPGFAISYIEAVKKYPPTQEDDGCGLETFVNGWIHSNTRDQKPKVELFARITYCDREGVSYMLPLGRITAGNRTHWIFQTSSWEREWYAVMEATPGRIRFVAEYFGGGRPPRF